MSKTKNFAKTTFGNVLEWYDFSVFAYYYVALSKAFFPEEVFSKPRFQFKVRQNSIPYQKLD